MAFNRHERTLSAKKSSAPIFTKGVPDNREGADGDVAYVDLSGIGTVQYVKKDNAWIPITSKFDFFTQGEQISQSKTIDGSFVSQLNFYLDKFRTDITDMVNTLTGSWAVGCNFEINYAHTDDTIINYLTFNTNSATSGGSATVTDKSFLVPRNCILKNINFAITVADASESAYVFELIVKHYTQNSGSTTTDSTTTFTASTPSGQSIRYVDVTLNTTMDISSLYLVTIRQTGFPSNNAGTKPSKATAYFSQI
mgnify:FL=1|tara:strand:+ start:685 stop:1443 length:759 start_codon:yes stop_codon:yes gene_type:complete